MQADEPPKPSSLKPDTTLANLAVQIDLDAAMKEQDKYQIDSLVKFQRVANYLSVAQIFLQSNALLGKPLQKDDVKRRLLGHFGTCPGLNLVYAHALAHVARDEASGGAQKVIFVTGPGHGAPAILSCLYLEGSITHFYPTYSLDSPGFEKFVRAFSWPGGFPSHVNAETPGAIHEGGELGYALSVAYGSVMDKPDLLTVCVVGDGESETGPTATAWHSHKYINPKESGAVLPILHVNGFKISERTIPGTMDDLELVCLYTGYGYQVRFVEYGDTTDVSAEHTLRLNVDLAVSFDWAVSEIRKIQRAAREGTPLVKPRWPMIVLRTPKGMTGPRDVGGQRVLGSFHAHQVPLPKALTDDVQFEMLKEWLESYGVNELFDKEKIEAGNGWFVKDEVLRILPKDQGLRFGTLKESYAGYESLQLSDFRQFGIEKPEASLMKAIGGYLADVVRKNPNSFRIFSPDEFESNKLDAVFDATMRAFEWDPETAKPGGRVIEILSEHTLQGFLQGYVLTGRHGLFPSYEAFLGIITTMVEQYAKFRKVAHEVDWRVPVASLNYIMTSTLWRQEHNGFSHQNPGLIGNLLTLPHNMVRVYLPPDANCALSVMEHCLRSKDYINLIVGSKADTPVFLTPEEAQKHCIAGLSVWRKFSTEEGYNPDVILVGIGVEVTIEIIAAAKLLQKEGVRVRVINVVDLMTLGEPGTHPHALSNEAFTGIFGTDTPVVINFHGYPIHVQSLLFPRNQSLGRKRFEILGYIEEGTTTTPWSMLRMNKADRFHICAQAVSLIAARDPTTLIASKAAELGAWYKHQDVVNERYALEHGADSEEVANTQVLFEG
jgi:xylulose-5-phosphate/fructose-6-phosphate phosphoketolase